MLLFWSDVDKKLPFSWVGSRVNSGFSTEDKNKQIKSNAFLYRTYCNHWDDLKADEGQCSQGGGRGKAYLLRYGCSHRKTGRVWLQQQKDQTWTKVVLKDAGVVQKIWVPCKVQTQSPSRHTADILNCHPFPASHAGIQWAEEVQTATVGQFFSSIPILQRKQQNSASAMLPIRDQFQEKMLGEVGGRIGRFLKEGGAGKFLAEKHLESEWEELSQQA